MLVCSLQHVLVPYACEMHVDVVWNTNLSYTTPNSYSNPSKICDIENANQSPTIAISSNETVNQSLTEQVGLSIGQDKPEAH